MSKHYTGRVLGPELGNTLPEFEMYEGTEPFNVMAQRMGAGYLLGPADKEHLLINQGFVQGVPAATLKGTAALVQPGLLDDGDAAELLVENDFVDSGWRTRINMLFQPSPEVANTQWTAVGGFFNNPTALVRSTGSEQFDGIAKWKMTNPGAANTEGAATGGGVALVKEKTYWASVYAKGAVGGESIEVGLGGAATGFALSGPVILSKTEWKRVSVKLKATATGAGAMAVIGSAGVGKKAQVVSFDCALLEESEVLGSFFPFVSELESGVAGWSGEAWESVSSTGPWAQGTKRTFVMEVKLDTDRNYNGIFGDSAAVNGLYVNAAKEAILRLGGGGAKDYVLGILPAGAAHQIAVTVDLVAKTAQLYIDGVPGEVKALTNAPNGSGVLQIGNVFGVASTDGKMLPFAVFTRKLSTTELVELNGVQRVGYEYNLPTQATQLLYERLWPQTLEDEANEWDLLKFCEAMAGELFELVRSYVGDREDGLKGWEIIFNVDLCPPEALPYLAQFVGVHLEPNLTVEQQREKIKDRPAFRRGTSGAILSATKKRLSGTKFVFMEERSEGKAYRLLIRTFTAETPEPAATLSDILEQKPAGIVLDYAALVGKSYAEWKAENPTYQQLLEKGTYAQALAGP